MTYEEYKIKKAAINKQFDDASEALNNRFPLNGGLHPDSVRLDPEYIELKRQSDAAFAIVRFFNCTAPNGFAKRLSRERRATR